jgi:hypothetical protein
MPETQVVTETSKKPYTVLVWPAPPSEEDKNTLLKPLLDNIKAHGGKIELAAGQGSPLLEDLAEMVMMPFIEIPSGARYYGLKSIKHYVEKDMH